MERLVKNSTQMKIINYTREIIIADNAKMADTFLSRMTGLLNRTSLEDREALIITQCQSIHMVFMKFAIDVIFIDSTDRVVGLVKEIQPFCFSPLFLKAAAAIELPICSIEKTQTQLGDQLQIFSN